MKKILTIDFDIIMAPSIELYNEKVPSNSWENLLQDPYMKLLIADMTHYQRLTNYIIDILPYLKQNQIHFINSHENVAKYIDDNEIYDIINIDHHHDIGYSSEDLDGDCKELNCANWVKYLWERRKINSYYWIHNKNSKIFNEEYQNKFPELINGTNFEDYILSKDLIPDELIICFSRPWVPNNYQSLYYLWMDIVNKYYGTHFDFEDKK